MGETTGDGFFCRLFNNSSHAQLTTAINEKQPCHTQRDRSFVIVSNICQSLLHRLTYLSVHLQSTYINYCSQVPASSSLCQSNTRADSSLHHYYSRFNGTTRKKLKLESMRFCRMRLFKRSWSSTDHIRVK
uniref:Uncharacterized protein n=1 Tax=Ditylenchus dipsaci TaxID=166011 RepID=A0A915EV60_9BILA